MNKFEKLVSFLEKLENDSYGEWIFDREHKGTHDDPSQMPYPSYTDVVFELIQAVYDFSEENPDYDLSNYQELLKNRGLEWEHSILETADVSNMDAQGIMAMLMGLVRGERFCSGVVLSSLSKGVVKKWLQRLKEISEQDEQD